MRKKRSWFYRLVTTYLPIVYLLAFVLFFVFFMTISQMFQKQTVSANEAFTRYTMLQLSSILGNIDQNMNAETINNKEFNQYMFQLYDADVNPYLLRSRIAERFRQIKSGFPFIYSIYFYRNADMSVLGTETYLPLSEFGDRDFVQEQLKQPLPSAWSNIRSYKELPTQPFDVKVVSLVKKVPFLTGPNGILVVNFEVSSLATWLQGISDSSISSIALVDQAGQLIGQSKTKANNDILSLKFDMTGWMFHSGIKDTYHYGIFSELYYSWIVIGILMVLVASVGVIYLSKRYAKPIDASISRISEYLSLRQAGQPGGELVQYVDAAVDKIIDFANRYQSESNSNLPYRQKHFFQELLTGDRLITLNELQDEMVHFGFSCKWHSFRTANLEIDRIHDFAEGYTQRDQVLLKFILSSVLKETAQQHGIGIWSEWISNDKLSILFGSNQDTSEAALDHACNVCESLRAWVEVNLAFTVTIGIGGTADRTEGIRLSYEQAVQAVQYRSTLGNNRVIDYTQTSRQTETELFEMLKLIRTIIHLYKVGDEDWGRQLQFLFSVFARGLHTRDELINIFHYMSFTFTRELSEFPAEYSDIWRQDGMGPIAHAIGTFETLDELQCVLFDRLRWVAGKWSQLREQRSQRSLIHEVRDYIGNYYGSSDLSLQHLSEKFGLSKNYLSRLFKDEMGENFIDYLTNVRMRHARELLEDPSLSIMEIAARVGYEHYFTFNRAFKKSEGLPPSDFRKKQGLG